MSCRVAALAREADNLISSCHDRGPGEALVALEEQAARTVANSPAGARYQLHLIGVLSDCICAAVPADSPQSELSESMLDQIRMMLASVERQLRPADRDIQC